MVVALDKEYNPSEKDRATVAMVKAWYKTSKRAFEPRKAVMQKCYDYYKGKHITQAERLKSHGPKSSRNYIFSSVEDGLALLTDNKPSLDCWPRAGGEPDFTLAEKGKQGFDWVWERTKMEKKLPMAARDSFIAGIGWWKVGFDPDIDYPHGEITVEVVHPYHIFPDPDATSMDTAKYIVQANPTPLWMIRKMYPKEGIYVKPDTSISDPDDYSTEVNADTDKETLGLGALQGDNHMRAWLIECWIRDDATFDEDEYDTEGKQIHEAGEVKYPRGRRIVVAGNVLLEDDHNPYEDGKYPYVPIPDYEQSDTFWPIGDVENIIETNSDINKIVSRLNDYIRNTAHTFIVYDDSCNIDEESLTNLEGALIKKSASGKVEITPPPNFPPAVFNWLQTCKSDLEIINGIREVLQGRDPKAGQSGAAFERLQEFALSRIRKKARNLDNALVELGELILSRIKQFYTPARQIRITGDFPITEAVQQDPMMGGQMMDPMMGQQPMMPQQPMQQQTGKYRPYDFTQLGREDFFEMDIEGNPIREIQLDVIMEVGTAASATRARDRNDALVLLDKGIVDQQYVAERFGIKNFQEIQARIQQKQFEQMMMQAQAQAQALDGEIRKAQAGGDPAQPGAPPAPSIQGM